MGHVLLVVATTVFSISDWGVHAGQGKVRRVLLLVVATAVFYVPRWGLYAGQGKVLMVVAVGRRVGEVKAVHFLCDGAPGPGCSFHEVEHMRGTARATLLWHCCGRQARARAPYR